LVLFGVTPTPLTIDLAQKSAISTPSLIFRHGGKNDFFELPSSSCSKNGKFQVKLILEHIFRQAA
jgi:hypothetical protein